MYSIYQSGNVILLWPLSLPLFPTNPKSKRSLLASTETSVPWLPYSSVRNPHNRGFQIPHGNVPSRQTVGSSSLAPSRSTGRLLTALCRLHCRVMAHPSLASITFKTQKCPLLHYLLRAASKFSKISGSSPLRTEAFTNWSPVGVRMNCSGERLARKGNNQRAHKSEILPSPHMTSSWSLTTLSPQISHI